MSGGALLGFSGAFCSVTTLDGKTHNTVSIGYDVGLGEEVSFGLMTMQTRAKNLNELGGYDFGFNAKVIAGGGMGYEQTWALDDPNIANAGLSYLVGAGFMIGAGGSRTFAW